MPNFMNLLSKHNSEHGISLTFSELKKTARRIQKAYDERPDKSVEDPHKYVLGYWDETGEIACGFAPNPFEGAVRRIAEAA